MTDKNDQINSLNKDQFIHLLANEAGFTLGDTRIFWKAVETIFERAIATNTTLNIPGFGKLYLTRVEPKIDENGNIIKRWDQVHEKWIDPRPYTKITFKISSSLRDALEE